MNSGNAIPWYHSKINQMAALMIVIPWLTDLTGSEVLAAHPIARQVLMSILAALIVINRIYFTTTACVPPLGTNPKGIAGFEIQPDGKSVAIRKEKPATVTPEPNKP